MSLFSEKLKRLRLDSGYTQESLAEKLHMTKSSINMYERGEREPNLEKLKSFANFFGVDMNYLLNFDFQNNEAETNAIKYNIRKLREYNSITQSELGDIAGVTDKAVSTWELGTNTPRMGAIKRIADHFGLQKSDIIEKGGIDEFYLNSQKVSLGDIIKEYRETNNLSMDDFARRSGLSKAYISMLEKGIDPRTSKEITPSLKTYRQVSLTFGIEFDDLIKATKHNEIPEYQGNNGLTKKTLLLECTNELQRLSLKDLEALLHIIKKMKGDK